MRELHYEDKNGVLVFKPENYIELEFKEGIESFVETHLMSENHILLFNLLDVQLINSHGASAFLYLFRHLKENSGILSFCCVNDPLVKATFTDTGIFWLCEKHIYDSEEEALVKLNAK